MVNHYQDFTRETLRGLGSESSNLLGISAWLTVILAFSLFKWSTNSFCKQVLTSWALGRSALIICGCIDVRQLWKEDLFATSKAYTSSRLCTPYLWNGLPDHHMQQTLLQCATFGLRKTALALTRHLQSHLALSESKPLIWTCKHAGYRKVHNVPTPWFPSSYTPGCSNHNAVECDCGMTCYCP